MGESKNSSFRVEFNKKLKIEFRGTQVTSDGGLVAIRELDEKLGLTELAGEYLQDKRYGKNILKKDFLGLAAHQLKTPMTPVREGIGILMEEMSAGLTREQKDMLEVIRRNIERIDKAVSRIIILQKLTGGLEDFFFRDTDSKEILDVIFFNLTRLSLLKKLHVEIRHAENLHKVRVDREKVILAYSLLGQVILNFTPHGPVILADGREEKTFFLSVETSSTTLDPQDLAYFTQETAVSYRVSRIASEFFLETAICRETMRRHGGHISAESAAGGIVVRLHFPINTKGNLNNE